MAIIFTWGKDLLMQPAHSYDWAKTVKQKFGSETEVVLFDSNMLCPFKFDHAVRQLGEAEIIEWMQTEVLPALEGEGVLMRKNGRYVRYEERVEEGDDESATPQ